MHMIANVALYMIKPRAIHTPRGLSCLYARIQTVLDLCYFHSDHLHGGCSSLHEFVGEQEAGRVHSKLLDTSNAHVWVYCGAVCCHLNQLSPVAHVLV